MTAQTLPAEMIDRLTEHASARRFARGDVIVHEGDCTGGIYIVVSGRLSVFTASPDGRELVFNQLVPGEMFGEMCLDGGARSASVRAVIDSECLAVGRHELAAFMAAHPAFAHFLVITLTHRLRHATEQVRQLGLHDVSERVIGVLRAEAVGREGHQVIPRELTQQAISQRVGATREMVNHVIQRLVRLGYLARTGRREVAVIRRLPDSLRALPG